MLENGELKGVHEKLVKTLVMAAGDQAYSEAEVTPHLLIRRQVEGLWPLSTTADSALYIEWLSSVTQVGPSFVFKFYILQQCILNSHANRVCI